MMAAITASTVQPATHHPCRYTQNQSRFSAPVPHSTTRLFDLAKFHGADHLSQQAPHRAAEAHHGTSSRGNSSGTHARMSLESVGEYQNWSRIEMQSRISGSVDLRRRGHPTPTGRPRAAAVGVASVGRRREVVVVRAGDRDAEFDLEGEAIADDYYSILGLTPTATQSEIKRAYYGCMKACHPDLAGANPDNVAFCMFVNEVYEVLSDPEMRAIYDEINGYSETGINPFLDPRHERDHAFVDELSCIGCKNCANTAEETFEMEELFGRARVCRQDGNPPPLVQEAIDTCPVNCIHWVTAGQLTLLEDEMRRMERVNAMWRWEKRQSMARARAKAGARKEANKRSGSQWGNFWEGAVGAENPGQDEETSSGTEADGAPNRAPRHDRAKMAQVAAAARRWRELSRKGVDRKATRYIAMAAEMESEEEGAKV